MAASCASTRATRSGARSPTGWSHRGLLTHPSPEIQHVELGDEHEAPSACNAASSPSKRSESTTDLGACREVTPVGYDVVGLAPMNILLTRPDAALARELEAAGHTALRWN